MNQPCVDGLVIHEPLFSTIAGTAAVPVTTHAKFLDLIQFVQLTHSW